MLGSYVETEVPDGKTFELHLDSFWYDKDGQYHTCTDNNSCDCKETLLQYIRKDNTIYFQSMDEQHKNCYTIRAYIVDDSIFFPELNKDEA